MLDNKILTLSSSLAQDMLQEQSDLQPMVGTQTQVELQDFIAEKIRGTVSDAFVIFLPGNPTTKMCDMPHNQHSFIAGRPPKHCTTCNLTFCYQHALTRCVNCGAPI